MMEKRQHGRLLEHPFILQNLASLRTLITAQQMDIGSIESRREKPKGQKCAALRRTPPLFYFIIIPRKD